MTDKSLGAGAELAAVGNDTTVAPPQRQAANDGGAAFPALEEFQRFDEDHGRYTDFYQPVGGMSLRDYFAAKALTGLMGDGWQMNGSRFDSDRAQTTASIAYAFADAMLKERAK